MRRKFLIVAGLFLITCNNTTKVTANTVTTTPPISTASGSVISKSEYTSNIDNLKDFVSKHFNIDEKTEKESVLETRIKSIYNKKNVCEN